MNRLLSTLAALAALLIIAPITRAAETTPITDIVYLADGTTAPVGSTITISWPRFTSTTNRTIPKGSKTVTIGADGSFTISLEPTDTAVPVFTYTAQYNIVGQSPFSEYWSIPTSTTPQIIQEIAAASGQNTVPAVRLSAKGSIGVFDGASMQALTPGANGTAIVADSTQAKGLKFGYPSGIPAANIGSGNVDNTHLGYLANVTSDLQTQINARASAASAQLQNRLSTNLHVVFDGDSLTAGFGLAKSANNTPACRTSLADASCQDWPSQMLLMSSLSGRATSKNNFAVSGNKIADVQGRYTASVHPLSPAVTGNPGILFMWAGANDFDASETASAIETALQTYWSGAKADGWTLAVGTIMRRGDDATEADEAVRRAVNTWIRSQFQAGAFDYLMDFDRLYQNPYDATLFQADTIHPTAAGAYLEAKSANGVIWDDAVGQAITGPDVSVGSGTGNYRGTWSALPKLTTGSHNTALGAQASNALTTGADNTASGYQSLMLENTGNQNTCYGYVACSKQVGRNNNTAVGWGALFNNTGGSDNTAIGNQAGVNLSTGSGKNTFVGSQAALNNNGNDNVAVGYSALSIPSTSFNNVAIGDRAAVYATGSQNVMIGQQAGLAVTGNNNMCIGHSSCNVLTTGTNNIVIGDSSQVGAATVGAVQLGTGTNSTNNTLQFQSVKLADNAGNLYAQQSTPASSTAACAAGAVWTDASYIYVCTAANTIKRAALTTF